MWRLFTKTVPGYIQLKTQSIILRKLTENIFSVFGLFGLLKDFMRGLKFEHDWVQQNISFVKTDSNTCKTHTRYLIKLSY
jgi:hypothetical protein